MLRKFLSHERRDALLQLSRNGCWGTCADCPRDYANFAYPEFCQNANRADHHLTIDGLADLMRLSP